MKLRQYDGACVRITDTDGCVFEGACAYHSREYVGHEIGCREDGLQVGSFLLLRGDIRAVKDLSGRRGPYGPFSARYGRVEEEEARDGADAVLGVLTGDDPVFARRMLACLDSLLAPGAAEPLPEREGVLKALRDFAASDDEPQLAAEAKRICKRYGALPLTEGERAVRARIKALAEPELAAFSAGLVPNLDPGRVLGVRAPKLRALAKQLAGTDEAGAFLRSAPHVYLEENTLHGFLLERERALDACLAAVKAFLPYIDNWATCDGFCPAVLRRHAPELTDTFLRWTRSAHVYTCRFGMGMLMRFCLDDPAAAQTAMQAVSAVSGDEYYISMMQAWFFATALAKQYDAALAYLTGGRLDGWVHNKTIRKAVESYRLTPEQKSSLRTMKR